VNPKDIHELTQVEPFHVAAFVHDLQDELSPPSVKQHLAAIRMLFDWLVTGHVIEANPAHSVRGPRYTVKKGKTPVLAPEEAHALLESIPVTKKPANDPEAADQPYLKNSGKLEVAQQIANHESPRTTKLYDRHQDEISLDEIERITI
jgi:hypothetical protein